MYQPRRALAPIDAADAVVTPEVVAAAAFARPRRAARTWRDAVAERTGPFLIALAAAATVGSIVLAGTATAQVAQPVTGEAVAGRVTERISRAVTREALPTDAQALADAAVIQVPLEATRSMYVASDAVLRAKPAADAPAAGSLTAYAKVTVTPTVRNGYREVVVGGESRWVLDESLDAEAPALPAGTSMAPCAKSSQIEAKIRPDTKFIYRSVCANFPGVNSFGGWRAGGLPFHRNGRATDIMLTPFKESALGHSIANYLIAHAKEFNIDHIIFEQKIWTPSTPHWRHMADRGGITANHFDHVHVAVRA